LNASALHCTKRFVALIGVRTTLPHKPIVCGGYEAVIYLHAATQEFTIRKLYRETDGEGNPVNKQRPKFVRKGKIVRALVELDAPVCMDLYARNRSFGAFYVRDEGVVVFVGKVIAFPK